MKGASRAIEGRSAVFSHPSGKSGALGKGIIKEEIFGW